MWLETQSRSDIDGFFDWNAVDVIKSSLIFDQKPSMNFMPTMQSPHIDYRITADPTCNLWATITAINSPVRLIVWPRSHALIMTLAEAHGWPTFSSSSETLDEQHARRFGCPDLLCPQLVTIHPGQTIIFHGMLVHAGAPGLCDDFGNTKPCHR